MCVSVCECLIVLLLFALLASWYNVRANMIGQSVLVGSLAVIMVVVLFVVCVRLIILY